MHKFIAILSSNYKEPRICTRLIAGFVTYSHLLTLDSNRISVKLITQMLLTGFLVMD